MLPLRYLFLVGLFVGCALTLPGQRTLHLVYTANPYPHDSIHVGCQVDERNAADLFTQIGESAREEGHDLAVRLHRPAYGKTELLSFLDELKPAPEDAVVFMFSGHGIEDPGGGHWPQLYYCDEPEEGGFDFAGCGLSLDRIHRLLRASGARMSLALASSCNHDPLLEDNEQTIRNLDTDGTLGEQGGQQIDFGLFTDFRGHIIASASKAGQPAYLTDEHGSYYVRAFLESVIEGLVADNSSWAQILHDTDIRVRQGFGKKQNAQFRIHQPDATAGVPVGLRGQVAYILIEEGLTDAERLTDAELDEQLQRLYGFYDRYLATHEVDYTEEAAFDGFVTALDTYGTEAFDRAYETALTQFAYLPEGEQDEVDNFLYDFDH